VGANQDLHDPPRLVVEGFATACVRISAGTRLAFPPGMRRAPILLLVPALLLGTVGCVPQTRRGSTLTTIAGGALAVSGGLMLARLHGPGEDSDHDGIDEFPDNEIECAFGGCAAATVMLVAGVVTGLVGLAGLATLPDEPAPGSWLVTPPPPPVDYAQLVPLADSLPERACDEKTLGLAKQARNLARNGYCDGALAIVDRIAEHDGDYAFALRSSAALGSCRLGSVAAPL